MEGKDIDVQHIWSEDKPVDIMTKNTPEAYFSRHMKSITEGKIWELVDTGRENVKKTGFTDDVIKRDKTGYSSHTLAEVMDKKKERVGLDQNIQDW